MCGLSGFLFLPFDSLFLLSGKSGFDLIDRNVPLLGKLVDLVSPLLLLSLRLCFLIMRVLGVQLVKQGVGQLLGVVVLVLVLAQKLLAFLVLEALTDVQGSLASIIARKEIDLIQILGDVVEHLVAGVHGCNVEDGVAREILALEVGSLLEQQPHAVQVLVSSCDGQHERGVLQEFSLVRG